MRINSLDIDRFGLWNDLHLTKLDEGLNVFYGPNEAGKTTLMDFVRSILYGMEQHRLRYIQPLNQDKKPESEQEKRKKQKIIYGGSLSVDCADGLFRIQRSFDPNDKHVGSDRTLTITSTDSLQRESSVLRMIVSGMDELTFNNVFTFGLDELRKLGTLEDTEAAEMLFRLSIGLDRVSLVDVLKSLTQSRLKMLPIDSVHNGTLERMFMQEQKLIEELGQSRAQVWEYSRLLTEQRKLNRVIEQLNEEVLGLQHEGRINEIALNILPIWDKRESIRTQLREMGTVIPVPADVIQELEEIRISREKKQGQLKELKKQYEDAQKRIEEVPVNDELWQLSPRIEIILEEETRIIELDQQITKMEKEADSLERELVEYESHLRYGRKKTRNITREIQEGDSGDLPGSYSSVGLAGSTGLTESGFTQSGSSQSGSRAVPSKEGSNRPALEQNRQLGEYRVYSRHIKRTKVRYARMKQMYDELQERSKSFAETMKTEMSRRDIPNLVDALEQTSEMVAQLRRRGSIAQRLEELGQMRKRIDQQNAYLIQNQAAPSWVLVLLGVAAIFTAICLVMIFTSRLHPAFAGAGGIALVLGFIGKIVMERNNGQKLDENQRQLSSLLAQLDQVKNDAAAIDVRFPANGQTLEGRIQNAQKELSALEKLIPLDAQRKETSHQLKSLESQLIRARESAQSATQRWGEWLTSMSLPADWTPRQIKDLIGRYDHAGEIRQNLDRLYEGINRRVRDLRIITDRIDRVVAETNLKFPDGLSYVEMLGEIRKALTLSEEGVRRRKSLTAELRKLRPARKRLSAAIQQIRSRRTDLLRRYGATSSEHLLQLAEKYSDYEQILAQEEAVQREINALMSGYVPEETVAQQVGPENRANLDNQKESINRRLETTKTHLREETEKHGRLTLELQQLAQDQSVPKKRRELAVLTEKLRRSVHTWQVQAVSCRILEDIRKGYERERQPQALAETSDYFRRLTAGKYQRVWTPLGEDTLKIDDSDLNTFDVSLLSRGTREQLFISLRLALAASFARHGSDLPLILDDVMVNFDTRRAQAAANVLAEFATGGRQIILFTCHEHICRIFQRMDVPVRILPDFGEHRKGVRVLLPISVLQKREADRVASERLVMEQALEEHEMVGDNTTESENGQQIEN
ncbi:MAG: AAA family ATPase [Thermoguttaceae bacterium]